ncbi:MAG: copper-translocating P-type ATPase [Clostridia bacterium]|nr:copper-translocating P-type ATPase [Clostridia bacterium]
MKKSYFTVTGMSCAACSASVEKAVSSLSGVSSVTVNLTSGKLTVEYDDKLLCGKDIEFAVTKIGFGVNHDNLQKNMSQKGEEIKRMKHRLIASAIFAVPLFYVSMGHMLGMWVPAFMDPAVNPFVYALVQLILASGSAVAGYKFYTNGFRNLFSLRPNMDTLVAVGTGSAFVYGVILMADMYINGADHSHNLYFESVGVIITLILLGKYLENRSKLKTSDAIVKLMELAPKKATVIRNGEKIEVDTEEILVGDIVAVLPGEKIPVDGIVAVGSTTVDESMLTGESIPVEKELGSKVFAGCINKYGYIEIETTVNSDETVISQIVGMVEEASGSKPQIAHFADKICGIFVPCVIGAALFTALVWLILGADSGYIVDRFISVLVVACPCALGLATPTAVIVSVGKAASEGILVKDAQAMEHLNSVDTFVFDKTGTLTKGEPVVTDFDILEGFDESDILKYAMSVESVSEHPLSDAIYDYALSHGAKESDVDEFRAIGGKGLTAMVDGKNILLGSPRLMSDNSVSGQYQGMTEKYTAEGKTTMILAVDGIAAAIIAARDTLKEDAQKTVEQIGESARTVLLTGDNSLVANAMARELGISKCISEVLPGEKADKIKELMAEGSKVAMVGDGINDSVALTVADVGIAVGSGTQVALEAADIVIMKDSLTDIHKAKEISHATIKNIKQNLFYAFIYNTALIPIAAGVLSFAGINFNPMLAAGAMALSSVSVVLNALRLRK